MYKGLNKFKLHVYNVHGLETTYIELGWFYDLYPYMKVIVN